MEILAVLLFIAISAIFIHRTVFRIKTRMSRAQQIYFSAVDDTHFQKKPEEIKSRLMSNYNLDEETADIVTRSAARGDDDVIRWLEQTEITK
jgi:hypothetical protein